MEALKANKQVAELINSQGYKTTIKDNIIIPKFKDNKNIAIEKLKDLMALPSQYIMDNRFYYGEFEIIGNLPLKDEELDFPISYSQSSDYNDPETLYLQYGKIYKETKADELNENLIAFENKFRYENTGFDIMISKKILEECIQLKSNKPYWESEDIYIIKKDLRNPKNSNEKEVIFRYFKM